MIKMDGKYPFRDTTSKLGNIIKFFQLNQELKIY